MKSFFESKSNKDDDQLPTIKLSNGNIYCFLTGKTFNIDNTEYVGVEVNHTMKSLKKIMKKKNKNKMFFLLEGDITDMMNLKSFLNLKYIKIDDNIHSFMKLKTYEKYKNGVLKITKKDIFEDKKKINTLCNIVFQS
jgi:glutaredoxin-related protein